MFDLTDDLARAERALAVAENRFQWAMEREDGRFMVDSVIHTLTAAALRLRAAVQRAKQAEAVERPRKAS